MRATGGGAAFAEPSGWWPARWVVPLFGLAALLLVPWVVLLVFALPSTHQAAHWDIAWAGFDVALAVLLLTVAVAACRRSPWLEGAATATATLLFVDAWFDVLTSSTRAEFFVSVGEAAFVELPLAILCLLLARSVERRLRVESATPPLLHIPTRLLERGAKPGGQRAAAFDASARSSFGSATKTRRPGRLSYDSLKE